MLFTTNVLFSLTLAYIAGICFTSYTNFSLAFVYIIGYLFCTNTHKTSILIYLVGAFFLGTTRYYQHKDFYVQDQHFLEKSCDIVATVTEVLPRLDLNENICITLHVSTIKTHNKSYVINKNIYLYVPFYTKVWLEPTQKIEIKNIVLKQPKNKSFETFLIREQIWAISHQKWLSYTTIKKPHPLRHYFHTLFHNAAYTTSEQLSQTTQALFLSIFCGKKFKCSVTNHLKQLFQYWGISHHLARSGIHLVILIALLLLLLSIVPCPFMYKQWLILSFLYVYYMMTYPSVAFLRAFSMYFFYTLCKQLRLAAQPVHILTITTLVILWYNPYHLFFLDFQLSFGITLLILWFFEQTQKRKTIAS